MDAPYLKSLPPEPPPAPPKVERSKQRQRPQHSLPTDRLKMDIQRKLLKSFATLSGPSKREIDGRDLAGSANLSPATAGLCNGFFADSGWIERTAKGKYAATDALLEYSRRLSLSPSDMDRVTEPLREAMARSWAWLTLAPTLDNGPIARQDALLILMREAVATDHPDHQQQLLNLLEWMSYVGLLSVTEDRVEIRNPFISTAAVDLSTGAQRPADSEMQEPIMSPQGQSGAPVVLAFEFSFKMTTDDLARLSPDQIKALYEAVGTVAAVTSRP